MNYENERLKKENEGLHKRITKYELADNQRGLMSKVNKHYEGKTLASGAERVIKVLVNESVTWAGNKPTLRDSEGKNTGIEDVGRWLERFEQVEGYAFTESSATEETPQGLCKSTMSEPEKAQYKKENGYDAYNALPFQSTETA